MQITRCHEFPPPSMFQRLGQSAKVPLATGTRPEGSSQGLTIAFQSFDNNMLRMR
jgi:hypothetical protein